MHSAIHHYNAQLQEHHKAIGERLAQLIDQHLPQAERKIWHGHPVWFLNQNPIVGYSVQKPGLRLMFWSGADFEEEKLSIVGKKFKDASIFYQHVDQIDENELIRWLQKAQHIQWDYKNLIKRKGQLLRI